MTANLTSLTWSSVYPCRCLQKHESFENNNNLLNRVEWNIVQPKALGKSATRRITEAYIIIRCMNIALICIHDATTRPSFFATQVPHNYNCRAALTCGGGDNDVTWRSLPW